VKRLGPSFRRQRVELKKCPACHGRGVVKPMFYEMPCTDCNAGGVVDKATGEALALEDLVLQLRLKANDQQDEIDRLRSQLVNTSPTENKHGPMGTYYRGD